MLKLEMEGSFIKPANSVMKFKCIVQVLFIIFLISFLAKPVYGQKVSIDELKTQLKNATSDSLKIELQIQLSREIHRKDHNEKSEYEYAEAATRDALKINDTILYAKALDNLGLLYRYHQWYSQAIPLHIKAFHLVENNKNAPPISKMIYGNNAGVAARYDQQYDLATNYYLKALRIAEKEKNLKNIAISSNGLGNTLTNISGYNEQALDYFKNALNAEKELGDSLGIAMDLLSIGGYYTENKDFVNARKTLDELYQINFARKDDYGLAITNHAYGDAYFKEGKDLKTALNYYSKALQQFRETGKTENEAGALRSLGNVYLKLNDLQQSLSYYTKSMDIAIASNDKSLISMNAYSISDIRQRQKNFSEALIYFKKGKDYEDSISLERQQIKIAALTNHYQLEQKENAIAQLEKENTLKAQEVILQEQKIQTHRLYFIILAIGLLSLLSLIYFQWRFTREKNRTLALLHKNQEELLKLEYEKSIAQAEMLAARTQLNPHFLFNSLTGVHLMMQMGEFDKADKYIIRLSRFFRVVLELSQNELISVNDEIELIRNYLNLEKNRFESGFNFEFKIPDENELDDILIPPLLLQPLVENAIWHGLLPSPKPEKSLFIIIEKENSNLTITIDDNGVGRNFKTERATGVKRKSLGMKLTRERIEQFNKSYDSHIEFVIEDKLNEQTKESLGTRISLIMTNYLKTENAKHQINSI